VSGFGLTAGSWAEIALAFGLAASAIVVLYLVRLRRRVVVVPFVHLFREALPDERTTRLFTRLKNVLSLLLALLVAALIAFALGLPRLRDERSEARTVVLLLDATASMQARLEDDDATRFDRAREAVLSRIATLAPAERAIVLSVGAHARVAHPLTEDHALLARAVRALSPTDAPGDPGEALAWAESLCLREGEGRDGEGRDGESAGAPPRPCRVEVYTDGGLVGLSEGLDRLRATGIETELRLVSEAGSPPGNVAITALSARRFPADPTRAELLVELTSFEDVPRAVTLAISADGQLAHTEVIELPPGGSVSRTLDELTGADALFEARLSFGDAAALARGDALALDDTAWARLAPRRRRRALLVAPEASGNVYLEAALLLDPYLDVQRMSPEAYEASGPPADRELLLFDGYTPAEPPARPCVLLAPGTPARPWITVSEPITRPHFETQLREHPLLAFVSLRDVNVASARPVVPAEGDEVVAGDPRGALLVTGLRGDTRFVALAFDVRESDLPLRIAWPILVLDAISHLVPDDVTLAPSARTGRPFRLAVERDGLALRRRGEDEGSTALALGARQGVAQLELDRVGVYDLTDEASAGSGPVSSGRLVVANLFDRAESGLAAEAAPDAITIDPTEVRESLALSARRESEAPRWPLHVLLVSAALALLALEWITFHRRWTT